VRFAQEKTKIKDEIEAIEKLVKMADKENEKGKDTIDNELTDTLISTMPKEIQQTLNDDDARTKFDCAIELAGKQAAADLNS